MTEDNFIVNDNTFPVPIPCTVMLEGKKRKAKQLREMRIGTDAKNSPILNKLDQIVLVELETGERYWVNSTAILEYCFPGEGWLSVEPTIPVIVQKTDGEIYYLVGTEQEKEIFYEWVSLSGQTISVAQIGAEIFPKSENFSYILRVEPISNLVNYCCLISPPKFLTWLNRRRISSCRDFSKKILELYKEEKEIVLEEENYPAWLVEWSQRLDSEYDPCLTLAINILSKCPWGSPRVCNTVH
ncbi:hypothetical protein [Gloeothece verrucosa]|uniref:Uncharacterized protein n=1 Tax=Gloeothece verrucosa (strain PCC 7822) TaxID=497965 RepID=E0UEN4_GLOV7|nr:hypothetical protein [Gloeothece verrucosa]ADN16602.1 hypothetical protein Cyan7822_4697 [Gloeothece verrucosa PCC 7822]